jgi:hypothetical protein
MSRKPDRAFGLDLADRFAPVGAGVDDFDVGKFLEPQLQALDGQFLIVDEDGADGHAVGRLPSRRSVTAS